MILLIDKESQKQLGEISDADFQFLVDMLEEEDLHDVDYYLDRETLEYLKENGMSAPLTSALESALGARDDIEIIFRKR
ncbi:MAG: galactosyldiacylglycerol synthase [Acidobacteria bacterium]|nr:MAG: galactosyldiacylglycerol synthase [Acidobacteriota bacterium]